MSLPVRIASGLWKDAELVTPGGSSAAAWRIALVILTALTVFHIVWACVRGGRLQHFAWPAPVRFVRWLSTPDKFQLMRNAAVDYLAGLRLTYYLWLGARGFSAPFYGSWSPSES